MSTLAAWPIDGTEATNLNIETAGAWLPHLGPLPTMRPARLPVHLPRKATHADPTSQSAARG